uniref:5-oxoprolinase subunit A n=1 Tax=Desulfurella acetivorans TaxID=33002 RepID=A0A832EXK1_DESAE
MLAIDLNADLGESFGAYKMGSDEELMKYITSANIACGMHGGDPIVINNTILMAKAHKVNIGAHPSYPDLQGFGRRDMVLSEIEIECFVLYQIGAVDAFCRANSVELKHTKPHGALYNAASKDLNIALSIASAIKKFNNNTILVGLANSKFIQAGKEVGIKVAKEVFADRAYDDSGFLVPRKVPGSVITDIDLAVNQALQIVKYKKVQTISGKIIDIQGDTICVHGDNPKAKDLLDSLFYVFKKEGIEILPLCEIVNGV